MGSEIILKASGSKKPKTPEHDSQNRKKPLMYEVNGLACFRSINTHAIVIQMHIEILNRIQNTA